MRLPPPVKGDVMQHRGPLHFFTSLTIPRTLVVVAMLLALLSILLVARGAAAGLFEPKVFKLDNGLEVIVIEDHRAPVVSHMVWYRVGAADEPPGKSGVAHFLEHLMFKRTDKLEPGEFSRIIARNGGRDNAFTSQDFTGYFQNVARDKLDLVMGLEASRMVNLQLTEDDLETERLVVLEERRSRTDNSPSAQLSEAMRAAQYMSHPYGIPVIGWQHEIKALGFDDVVDFYRRHYAPNNAILIVAGDVTGEEVLALAEKHYGAIPPSENLAPRVRPQEPPQLAARRVIKEDARVGQPSMRRTYLAPSRTAGASEHAVPLQLLSDILGGGTTSRLYQELVVKQQLAAGAGSYYGATSLDPTSFYVYATPNPGVDLDTMEQALDKVIADLLADGVTQAELERSRTGLLASAVYARDNMFSGPRIFGDALTSGLSVDEVEAWPDKVAAVTTDDVLAAARAVLDMRRSVTGLLLPKREG